MKLKRQIIPIILVMVTAVGVMTACTNSNASSADWDSSGFIEAEEISIAPEIAGRIVALPVSEGDTVRQGERLLRLADDVLSAQVDLARGKLEEAQAMLAQAQKGARREAIDKAEAQLMLAQAARDAARQAWLDAQAIRDNPQMLDVQIAAARAQVTAAQKQLEAALLQRDIAEKAWKDYGKTSDKLSNVPQPYRPSLPPSFYDIPYQWEQALAAVNAAQANVDAAHMALNHLLAQRSNPQAAQAQVDAAYAQYRSAEAAVAQAQAALDAVKAGATQEQIDAAKAQVEMAQAGLRAAQEQLSKTDIGAPVNGIIVASSLHVGEMAAPNVTAMTLADLEQVTLTIYVPGSDLGKVVLGQTVNVRVDAFADRVFPGTIVHIGDQAEYTPRSVRTAEERVKQVYAAKIKIDNPDHVLKPGLQAEAQVGQ
jgi:multidrug efflux pump subunit AcrA (membrane-fusion protein)